MDPFILAWIYNVLEEEEDDVDFEVIHKYMQNFYGSIKSYFLWYR